MPPRLKWLLIGSEKPGTGVELTNEELTAALESNKTEFTEGEWSAFGIEEPHPDVFISAGGLYFKPLGQTPPTFVELSDVDQGS
eukprot:7066957-Prymnesium_polylepis.1